jgi:hypothetical protein
VIVIDRYRIVRFVFSTNKGDDMKGYYLVQFTNIPSGVVNRSDISWCVTVSAESEESALEQGLADVRVLNRNFGMPPNGVRQTITAPVKPKLGRNHGGQSSIAELLSASMAIFAHVRPDDFNRSRHTSADCS